MSGTFSGLAAAAFLFLLKWATDFREENLWIISLLPIGGFAIGWLYFKYGRDFSHGHNLILDEIHDPKKIIPLVMAPFILVGTIVTHLFGGSAGREGTAVQMGASLSDQLTRIFKLNEKERVSVLMAGIGSGFGGAIGAPIAGAIFGMEVISGRKLKIDTWVECFVASFAAYYLTKMLKAPHSIFPDVALPAISPLLFIWIILAGICFGLAARVMVMATHFVEKMQSRFVSYLPLRPFMGGLLLISLYYLEHSYRYAGLGINVIQDSLVYPSHFKEPFLKLVFTAITVGSGFKGGEFIPLVFIGATLGSALSTVLPVSFQLLSALGFASVFGAAANTPLACAAMAGEIFGYKFVPFALLSCYISFYFSGRTGIYKSQRPYVRS